MTKTTSLQADSQPNPDAAILAAWGRRSVAYAIYNASPMDDQPDHNPDHDLDQLSIVDTAENEIRKTVATTPLGAEIQLWAALMHCDATNQRPDNEAANIMDLGWFLAKESDFDWKDRLILAALNSLRTMRTGGAA